MHATSYSNARQHLAEIMDQVCDKHETIIITRKLSQPVVMMSLEDFNSFEETAYLLKSPNNAEWLRESIEQFEEGKYKERELIE